MRIEVSIEGKRILPPPSGPPNFLSSIPTFWYYRSDRIRDAIDIVSPGTSFASSALVRAAISFISIEVRSSSAPTTMLDGEQNHLPFPCNLVAFVDGIDTSLVVSSNPWVGAIDLGNSSVASVSPASKMDVG